MKIVKLICDHCQKEIEDNPFRPFIEEIDKNNEDILGEETLLDSLELHLCGECASILKMQIKKYCNMPHSKPAEINQDFEAAVDEMVNGSKAETSLTDAQQKIITERFKAKWSITGISKSMNIPYKRIDKFLQESGAKKVKKQHKSDTPAKAAEPDKEGPQ